MSLLLAPYTNAMRLGQGFNSYSQKICIDDAVVIDEQRPENVVTNDGTTMRILAQKNSMPSAWTRQKEVLVGKLEVEGKAQKAKEVSLTEAESTDEDVEAISLETESESESDDEISDVEAKKDEVPKMLPKPKDNNSVQAAKGTNKAKTEEAKEEPSAKGSGSVDQVADADEACQEANVQVVEEGKAETPRVTSLKLAKSFDKPKELTAFEPDRTTNAPGGGASSAVPDPKAANNESVGKLAHVKEDDNDFEPEAAIANLQAKNQNCVQKKPKKRARHVLATTSAGHGDVARTALARKVKLDRAKRAEEDAEHARRQHDEELLAEERRHQKELLQEKRKYEAELRAENYDEQRKIRAEKRAWDEKRREDARKAIEDARKAIENAVSLKANNLADLEKIRAQNQFVERFNGMFEQTQKYDFDPTAPRGPSQTVTYTSRFVDRLSDVMDDISVSGSLSIKAGKVGGSGKGSFVDSDKFKESDLNFYISVKVVNQTINFKDALVFNRLSSINPDDFQAVYGDSFISGFVEGGEFNAVVSMKILNKAKKTDIQAEAKVAFTAGVAEVDAEGSVGIARSNIETNTETTIQVYWSGGGHIKPMEQQWNIQSLMAAAARFPDLVADCPQRTYAILSKYDSLRSFVKAKPASYTQLQYENAQIYTKTLLDSFVSYKSLYKRLGEQIFGVQGKILEIIPWSDNDKTVVSTNVTAVTTVGSENKKSESNPLQDLNSKFEASIKGLSDARTGIRRQMARIVNEVDVIEKNPKLATDEMHEEPYQSPVAFEARIPTVEVPERLRVGNHPLSGKRIEAGTLSEDERRVLQETKQKLIDAQKALDEKSDEIAKKDRLISELKKTRDNNSTMGAQFGSFTATEKGWHSGVNATVRCSIIFPYSYSTAPKLLFGLCRVDAQSQTPLCLSLALPDINASGFSIQAAAKNGCHGHDIGCSWLTLPDNLHLETSVVHTYGAQAEYEVFNQRIFFGQGFDSPPKVCVWIQGFECYNKDTLAIRCGASDVTSHSFNLKIESWMGRKFKNASVQYLAYPAEEDGRRIKSGSHDVGLNQNYDGFQILYCGQPFEKQPKIFVAMSMLDISNESNLRFHCSAKDRDNNLLELSYGTWEDSKMYGAQVQWIAIE